KYSHHMKFDLRHFLSYFEQMIDAVEFHPRSARKVRENGEFCRHRRHDRRHIHPGAGHIFAAQSHGSYFLSKPWGAGPVDLTGNPGVDTAAGVVLLRRQGVTATPEHDQMLFLKPLGNREELPHGQASTPGIGEVAALEISG